MAHKGALTLSINLSRGVSSTRENRQSSKMDEATPPVEDEEDLQIYSSASNSRSSEGTSGKATPSTSGKATPDVKDNSCSSRPTSSMSKRSGTNTPLPNEDEKEKEMITMNVPTATTKSRKRKHIMTNFDEAKMLDSDALDAQRKEKERLERLERIENSLTSEDHISQVAALNNFPLIDLTDIDKEFSSSAVSLGTSSISDNVKVEHEVIDLSSDDEDEIREIGSFQRRRIDPTYPSPRRGRSQLDRGTVDEMERQQFIEEQRLKKREHMLKLADIEKIDPNAGRLIVNRGHPADDPDIAVSPHLTRTLQPHQLGGICFMYNNVIESLQEYKNSPGFGCILAHSMGLGKTLQIVTFTEIFFRATKAHKVLILMPVNTIQNWLNEFDKWMPKYDDSGNRLRQWEVFILGDSVKTFDQRVNLLEKWSEVGGVLLIGYDMFRLLIRATQPKKKKKERMKLNFVNGQRIREEDEAPDNFDQGFTSAGRVKREANDVIRQALLDPGPELVVCDEGHKIKALNTDISQALSSIRTTRRIILTGYPLQNNLMEYYCMVDFVRPKYLGDRKSFAIMFEKPIKNGQCVDSTPADVKLALQRTHILIEKLKGFVQRRTHHLLKKILPQSKEYVLLLRKSPLQHLLYRNFILYAQSEIRNGSNVFNPLKAFAACSKIWNHPDVLAKTLASRKEKRAKEKELHSSSSSSSLSTTPFGMSLMQALNGSPAAMSVPSPQQNMFGNFNGFGVSDLDIADVDEDSMSAKPKKGRRKQGETLFSALAEELDLDIENGLKYDWAEVAMSHHEMGKIEHGYKMKITMDIIEECVRVGEKILVFSQNLTALDLIEQYLQRKANDVIWTKNRTYFRLDGSTNGTEREKLVNRFNSDAGVHLFLISTRAGSLGINLVSANRCIILDACWNPCHDAQAVCRVYRYGQQRRTYIYRLVMDNSMEKAIFNRQISKHGLQQRVVDDAKVDANVTQKDLETLLLYDEALDVRSATLDTSEWEIEDDLLKRVIEKNSMMLSAEPFLHESLMIEREEGLSEQEKREAEVLYERERRGETTVQPSSSAMMLQRGMGNRMPMSSWPQMSQMNGYDFNAPPPLRATPMPYQMQMVQNGGNDGMYGSYNNQYMGNGPSSMQPYSQYSTSGDFNTQMYPSAHVQQNQMYPPHHQYNYNMGQQMPSMTPNYTFSDGSEAVPGVSFPGASVVSQCVSNNTGSMQRIVLDRDFELSNTAMPQQKMKVYSGQEVTLVRVGQLPYIKTSNGIILDAKNTVLDPNSMYSSLPQLGPADLIELD